MIKKKNIFIIIIVYTFFISIPVHANYAIFYSKDFKISIKNINDNIEKIELFNYSNSSPETLFDYEIGTINDTEIRLYKITDYDKTKYRLLKEETNLDNIDRYLSTYNFDTNKETFKLYELKKTKEIKNIKIKDNLFNLTIKDIDKNYSNVYIGLRFYLSNGKEKEIYIGNNSYQDNFENKAKSILHKEYDYLTGKEISSNTIEKNNLNIIRNTFILVWFAILITLIIELLVAKKMNFKEYKLIITTNIITQLILHTLYFIPDYIFDFPLADLIDNISPIHINNTRLYFLLILEISIVFVEYLVFIKFTKDYSKRKLLKYSILANIASFIASIVITIILTIIYSFYINYL